MGHRSDVFVEKFDDVRVRLDPIVEFREAVPFVLENERPYGDARVTRSRGDLFGFTDRNPRIVRAVDHEQRRVDSIDRVDRRDRFEEFPIFIERAVLRFPERAPPRSRVLEKRDVLI